MSALGVCSLPTGGPEAALGSRMESTPMTAATTPVQRLNSLESDLFYAKMQLDQAERQLKDRQERVAEIKAAIAALKAEGNIIELIDPEDALDQRQKIHRALNRVRKETGAKGISLPTNTKYNGDELARSAYVSYPIGQGLGKAIADALKAEGLPVEWDGSEYRAIAIVPARARVWVKIGGYVPSTTTGYSQWDGEILSVQHDYEDSLVHDYDFETGAYKTPVATW